MASGYEFSILSWYYHRDTNPKEYGLFYNYATNEALREIHVAAGYPYAVQLLSSEGWQLVHTIKKEPQADNDWTWEFWFQRMTTSDSTQGGIGDE